MIGVLTTSVQAQSAIGIEFGTGRHTQLGSFSCDCGSTFTDGTGKGLSGSLFVENAFGRDYFVGIKAGLDQKKLSTLSLVDEIVIVNPGGTSKLDTLSLLVSRVGAVTTAYVRFEPFFQYQILHSDFFLQIGAGISVLTSSHFTQTRELVSNSAMLKDGTAVDNLTFTNGAQSETIEDEDVQNANQLRFSGLLSAGYNLGFWGIALVPNVTYDYPLNSVQTDKDWKISSLYGSVALKYILR